MSESYKLYRKSADEADKLFHQVKERDITIEGLEAEVERLKGEAEELREATIRVMASLAGAISLLERGGKAAKKAAPSDKMFALMLDDYSRALDAVRDLLSALEAKP